MTLKEIAERNWQAMTPEQKQAYIDAHERYKQTNAAHIEAERIDVILDRLLSEYPVERLPYFWFTLSRRVKTTLEQAENKAHEHRGNIGENS